MKLLHLPVFSTAVRLALLFIPLAQPVHGDVTYTLQFDPASSPEAQQVANSVAVAAAFYNEHGSFNKHWNVYHNPGIPTAEANYTGYMGYGGVRNERVVFHEAAHTFGMGTHGGYGGLFTGGVWTGYYGNRAQLETYNDYSDGLHGDGHAIWPGGFNFDNEDGFIQRHWHTRVMAGMRADLGLLSFTREAQNELVHSGETAEFKVESPMADTYQWYKNGQLLPNGLRVTGATSAVLRITTADASDEGSYHCVASGAGETLSSRPRQLWVDPAQQLGNWAMEANVNDSANSHHGTAFGAPVYAAGKTGQAIDLDGIDDYVKLPPASVLAREITIATWVRWDGGNNWQRIFDFGNNQNQYIYLSPKSGSGTMRLGLKDAINGIDTEYQVNAPALVIGQWVHVAMVLHESRATLYVNGSTAGTVYDVPVDPSDFSPTLNYIGKSQYPDPLFNGRIDDFQIYNHALSDTQIWNLAGRTDNNPPVFDAAVLTSPDAIIQQPYLGQSLAERASDPEGHSVSFAKLHGPSWLSVSANGTLSGTPSSANFGPNVFFVSVTDSGGASSQAELRINVDFATLPAIAHWTFEEGTANALVPYGPSTAGQYDGTLLDQSGNGLHLSAWSANWHVYRAQVPAAITPQTGVANSLSVQNSNSFPALSAIGTALTNWNPQSWSIEAAIRPDDATNGHQTFVGRDSRGATATNRALAGLYFAVRPAGQLSISFIDAAGNYWYLESSASAVQDGKWHAVAATSDGSNLRLYLKNLTNGDPTYTLLGTLNISSSSNRALHPGSGNGNSWDPGVFTIGRGLYNGSHTDRFFGHLDEIRFHGRALTTSEFLFSTQPIAAVPSDLSATAGVGSVELDWTDVSNATNYSVYRSTTSGSGYAAIATGVTASSYADSNVSPGTTYYYVATASNALGESSYSNTASATPQYPIPAPPIGLTATPISASQINLAWSPSTGAISYNVKRSSTTGGPYSVIASGLTSTAFNNTNLAGGTTYHYVVSAQNTAGESPDSSQASAATAALPTGWTAEDIGSVGISGTSSESGGTYSLSGSGVDIWGNVDAFQFAHTTLSGNGEIRARVKEQSNTDPWAKAGIMIRDGSSSGAINAFVAITPANGFTFQWRATTAGASNFTSGPPANTSPNNWVRLTRSGTLVTAYVSANGTTWTQIGTTTLTMGTTTSVGLAVTSHNNAALGTAAFDNVTITPYPSPWLTVDVGTTGVMGSAEYFGGDHTVKGAGIFGGTSDGFRYVYQTLSADGSIVARVNTLQNTGTGARVGVMIRDTLNTNSRMAALTLTGSGIWRWDRRTTTGGSISSTSSSSGTAPNLWVRLVRNGNTITASRSTNNSTWTQIGSVTVNMSSNCYIGLANASGSTTTLNTSVLNSVTVVP
jgi:regulation of enolase protein 1 (concanavalin A-like superfamily)